MSLSQRIRKLQNKTEPIDPIELITRVMKYFSWTLEDVKKLTIPAFLLIIQTINKIDKKDKKDNNNGNKKT